jgi:hypothetical protein
MREIGNAYKILIVKPKGKKPLVRLGVDGWIIYVLNWILNRV